MIPPRLLELIAEAERLKWTGQIQLDVKDGRIEKIGRLERERVT